MGLKKSLLSPTKVPKVASDLVLRMQKVADETGMTMENAIIFLIKLGLDAYDRKEVPNA